MIKLIVGLGNPGNKYEKTRHNVGFQFIDFYANLEKIRFTLEKFSGLIHKEGNLIIGKPLTFMNNSGSFVSACAKFYQIAAENILVVHDEMDLPVGTLKLRLGGGHNGQRGVEDIIRMLGTDRFARLKVGIGRPPKGFDPANYVLDEFNKTEEETAMLNLRQPIIETIKIFAVNGFEPAAFYANNVR